MSTPVSPIEKPLMKPELPEFEVGDQVAVAVNDKDAVLPGPALAAERVDPDRAHEACEAFGNGVGQLGLATLQHDDAVGGSIQPREWTRGGALACHGKADVATPLDSCLRACCPSTTAFGQSMPP